MDWAAVGSIATAIGTVSGLIYVAHEVRSARKVSEADLILRTQTEFVDSYLATYACFSPGGKWAPGNAEDLDAEDIALIQHYFEFFATLETLRDRRLLPLSTIDDMFALGSSR